MPPRQVGPSPAFGVGATLGSVGLETLIELYVSTHRYTEASQSIGRKILKRFALETGDPEPDELTEAHVHHWWQVVSQKAAARSLRAYHSTVHCFLDWLHLGDLISGIRRPREPRSAPRVLSPAEVDRLRMTCHTMRDRSIIELGHGIGLRAAEVASLEVPDIDWSGRLLYVHSKGGHDDELPLPDRVAWVLTTYFEESPPPPTGFAVRNLYHPNRGLTANYVTQRTADISYRAGVKQAPLDGRGMHGLRRGFASDLHDAGVLLADIKDLMRHENIATTDRYIRQSKSANLREALEKREAATTTGDAA